MNPTIYSITFHNNTDFQSYLGSVNSPGLEHIGSPLDFSEEGSVVWEADMADTTESGEDEQANTMAVAVGGSNGRRELDSDSGDVAEGSNSKLPPTTLIRHWSQLRTGQLYRPAGTGRFRIFDSLRTYASHLVQIQEHQCGHALLDFLHIQHPDLPCFLDDSMRLLPSKSRHELELDAVVNCGDRVYVLSHKTWIDSIRPIKKLLEDIDQIRHKSQDHKYTRTKYAAFADKAIVPVFVAGLVSDGARQRVKDLCQKAQVVRGYMTGRNINFAAHLQALTPI
ncbi:hypothetical protein GPECTOR_4g774 [Gonium pectorale]|uniref:Uncharacterized protein n=1 Tax=Gonium pectorale TaxID=33097 RepID=A0A150GXR9_GONPE|nr:hypothetical protein GPECTOR_4g774 [Gonium pectorale]|eukprot:KXZ54706.1 hypothetical protein GPECTOR_4g774 [Gonium pectorale]